MGTPAPDSVKRLVDRFDQDRKVFVSPDYKEEQLRAEFLNPFFAALGWDMDKPLKDIIGNLYYPDSPYEFSVIANSVYSSWSIVPGTEDRKPETKNREPGTDEVIRLTAGHQAKVEERSKGLVPTRALDGPSAPRRLSAMQTELRPALTDKSGEMFPKSFESFLEHQKE